MAMLTMLAICVLLVFDIIWYYLSVYIYTHRYIATLKKIETWNPTKVLVNYVSILFWVAILTYTVYLCLVVTQFSLYGLHTELAMWLEKHRIASRYCEDQRQLLEHQHVAWTFHSFKSIGLSLDHHFPQIWPQQEGESTIDTASQRFRRIIQWLSLTWTTCGAPKSMK